MLLDLRKPDINCASININYRLQLIVVSWGTSDLPDMYTQAQGPLGPRAWVYISGKITSARDTTNIYHV